MMTYTEEQYNDVLRSTAAELQALRHEKDEELKAKDAECTEALAAKDEAHAAAIAAKDLEKDQALAEKDAEILTLQPGYVPPEPPSVAKKIEDAIYAVLTEDEKATYVKVIDGIKVDIMAAEIAIAEVEHVEIVVDGDVGFHPILDEKLLVDDGKIGPVYDPELILDVAGNVGENPNPDAKLPIKAIKP